MGKKLIGSEQQRGQIAQVLFFKLGSFNTQRAHFVLNLTNTERGKSHK
jgi:hypothetical protein